MPRSQRRWLVLTVLVLLVGAAWALWPRTIVDRDSLAASGQVEADAPIRSENRIATGASPAQVWRLLSEINGWPKWQPDVKSARLFGPVVPGTAFEWNTGGTTIRSRIALARAPTIIAWSGTALGLHAVHVWALVPAHGGVIVTTRESMSGFPTSLFYDSSALHEANERWLVALKKAAERRR